MSVYSIYFSPTGGTAKVMDIVADVWKADAQIDLSVLEDDLRTISLSKKTSACLAFHPMEEGFRKLRLPGFGG